MLGALGALGAFLLTQSSCTTYTRVQGAAAPQLPSKSLFFGEGHVRLLGFRKINSACFFFFFPCHICICNLTREPGSLLLQNSKQAQCCSSLQINNVLQPVT